MRMTAIVRAFAAVAATMCLASCAASQPEQARASGGGSPSPSPSYEWQQDCGLTSYKHAPHNPALANDPSYKADEYVGLSVEEAESRAKSAGLQVRVLGADGECSGRTDDATSDRVNFYVEAGTVRAAARY